MAKNRPVPRFAPPLTVLALLAALCGAPLVHVHEAEEDEHHGALLHAHAERLTLHHHDDGVEISDHEERHAARYLELFQAKITSAPALAFLVARTVEIEEPAAARISRPLPDSRSHDPPHPRHVAVRGPPA